MYRYLRLLFLAGTFAGAFSTLARSQDSVPPLPETYFPALKNILDQAAKQSPRMISRNAATAMAEWDRISARSGQLPSAGGSVTYYPWDRQERADQRTPLNPKGATNVKRVGYGFSITQPLFHWGALKNTTRVGELQLKIAQGQTAEAYRLLAEEIRSQYLGLILKKAYMARHRASQQIAEDQLALARTKLEKHVIAEADMFSPTIAAEQARLLTDHNESDYENARILFGKLYGAGPISDDQIPTEIPAISPASSSLQSLAAQFSAQPETYLLLNAKRGIDVEELNYKIAATRLLPKVNVIVGTSQDQQSYSINPGSRYQVRDYYAGLALSWTIFDGFAAKAAKASSLIRRRQLEQAYNEQTAELAEGIKNRIKELEFSGRNLAIVEKLLESNANYIRVKQEDQGRGLATETEMQSARLGFQDSQINAYSARADYLMKVADLVSVMQKDPILTNLPAQIR